MLSRVKRSARLPFPSLLLVVALAAVNAGAAGVTWQADPALAAQFLPHGPMRAAFELAIADASLADCVAQERAASPPEPQPGPFRRRPWAIERVAPTDAFGSIGGYDRVALVKLFGARRVQVARGPKVVEGRAVGSVTLLSPYPDATMNRLVPGTLRIITWLPR